MAKYQGQRSIDAAEVSIRCANDRADICCVIHVPEQENQYYAVFFDDTRKITNIQLIDNKASNFNVEHDTAVIAAENLPNCPIKPGYYTNNSSMKIVDNNTSQGSLATDLEFDRSIRNTNNLTVAERAAIVEAALTMADREMRKEPMQMIEALNASIASYDRSKQRDENFSFERGLDDIVLNQRQQVARIMETEQWQADTRRELNQAYTQFAQNETQRLEREGRSVANSEIERVLARNDNDRITMNVEYNKAINTVLSNHGDKAAADGLVHTLGNNDQLSFEQLNSAIKKNQMKFEEMVASGVHEIQVTEQSRYIEALTKASMHHPELLSNGLQATDRLYRPMDSNFLNEHARVMTSGNTTEGNIRNALGVYGDMTSRDFEGFLQARSQIVKAFVEKDSDYRKAFDENATTMTINERRDALMEKILSENPSIDRVYGQQFMKSAEFLNIASESDYLYLKNSAGAFIEQDGRKQLKPSYQVDWSISPETKAAWDDKLSRIERSLATENSVYGENSPLLLAQKRYVSEFIQANEQMKDSTWNATLSHGLTTANFTYSERTINEFKNNPHDLKIAQDYAAKQGVELDFTSKPTIERAYQNYYALSELQHLTDQSVEKVLNELNHAAKHGEPWSKERLTQFIVDNEEILQSSSKKKDDELLAMLTTIEGKTNISAAEAKILAAFSKDVPVEMLSEDALGSYIRNIRTDINNHEINIIQGVNSELFGFAQEVKERTDKNIEYLKKLDFEQAFLELTDSRNAKDLYLSIINNHEWRNNLIDDLNTRLQSPEEIERMSEISKKISLDYDSRDESTRKDLCEFFNIKYDDLKPELQQFVVLWLNSDEARNEVRELQECKDFSHGKVSSMMKTEALDSYIQMTKFDGLIDYSQMGKDGYVKYLTEFHKENAEMTLLLKDISERNSYVEAKIAQRQLESLVHGTDLTEQQQKRLFETVENITQSAIMRSDPMHAQSRMEIERERIQEIFAGKIHYQGVQAELNDNRDKFNERFQTFAQQIDGFREPRKLNDAVYVSATGQEEHITLKRYSDIVGTQAHKQADGSIVDNPDRLIGVDKYRKILEQEIRSNPQFDSFDRSAEQNAIRNKIAAIDKQIANLQFDQESRKLRLDGYNDEFMHLRAHQFIKHDKLLDSINTVKYHMDRVNHEIDDLREKQRQLETQLNRNTEPPKAFANAYNAFDNERNVANAEKLVAAVVREYGTPIQQQHVHTNMEVVIRDDAKEIKNIPYEARALYYEAVHTAAEDRIKTYQAMPDEQKINFTAQRQWLQETSQWAAQESQSVQRMEQAMVAYSSLKSVEESASKLSYKEVESVINSNTRDVAVLTTVDIRDAIKESDVKNAHALARAYGEIHVYGTNSVNSVIQYCSEQVQHRQNNLNEGANVNTPYELSDNQLKTLRSIERFDTLISDANNREAIVEAVMTKVTEKYKEANYPLSADEADRIKSQLSDQLFNKVGNAAVEQVISASAEKFHEYDRQQALLNPTFEKLDLNHEAIKGLVGKYYGDVTPDLPSEPAKLEEYKKEEAIATMGLIKSNGVVSNDGQSFPVSEPTLNDALENLKVQYPKEYERCLQAVRDCDVSSMDDGPAKQTMTNMKTVVEQLDKAAVQEAEKEATEKAQKDDLAAAN